MTGGRKILRHVYKKTGIDLLKIGNYILMFLVIGILGYVPTRYFVIDQKEAVALSSGGRTEKSEVALRGISFSETEPFDFYRERIKQRDVFHPLWGGPERDTVVIEKVISDLTRELRLVGIVLDGDPKAAVEDLKEKETVFMSEGERIRDALLEKIEEGRVIFVTDNERVELVP